MLPVFCLPPLLFFRLAGWLWRVDGLLRLSDYGDREGGLYDLGIWLINNRSAGILALDK